MVFIKSSDIKSKFLEFFEQNNHLKISDSSIIPKNDPTLLFINSGMAPLKRFFTGEQIPQSKRLCNIQPCIRTIDIDQVGDKHHLTSFQMLGSWSIGDYFKEDAIKLAYKFLTESMNIPKEKLYVTIFGGDDSLGLEEDLEAKNCWLSVGVPEEHIISCPKEDNFWGPTSETGPCGPCTEVFYDTGDESGIEYIPGGYFDTQKRYIEIWNAGVFMQFNKNQDGSYSKLKFKSVDTGAGLERLAMVLNNQKTVYDTDLLKPIKDEIINQVEKCNASGIPERDILIMTDHLRTVCLILSEKVVPSNEGRGYIPRKLLRKCIMMVAKSNILNFDFNSILNFIIDKYSYMFKNFLVNKNYILETFEKEYKQFVKVITVGLEKLEFIKQKNCSKNQKDSKTTRHFQINADEIFELVTTFGLPFDIIKDYCQENNLTLDQDGYDQKLKEHKNISKNSQNPKNNIKDLNLNFLKDVPATVFEGYDSLKTNSKILNIINKENSLINKASKDDMIGIVAENTVFYAESGGQCSDVGIIFNDNFKIQITDVQKTSSGVFIHFGKVLSGEINLENEIQISMVVDQITRQKLSNNHTSVHLLHSALRTMFGQELHQSGSKVEKERLRFDFNYDKKINTEDIFKIEQLVNSYIRKNLDVITQVKSIDEAIEDGAIALFESKYSQKVRVVSVQSNLQDQENNSKTDISKELCGGTHTSKTGNIGLFVITSVEGIGKGIKRVCAVTGEEAISYLQEQLNLIKNISQKLLVKPEKILDKILSLQSKQNNSCKMQPSENELSYEVKTTKSGLKIAFINHNEFNKSLRDHIISLADKLDFPVVYLAGEKTKQILVASSKKNSEQQPATKILNDVLSKTSGKGGGSPRIASGGGITTNTQEFVVALENI